MTVTLFLIRGVIDPPQPIPLASCSRDRPYSPSRARICEWQETYPTERIEQVLTQNQTPAEGDTTFWAARSIFYFSLLDNFISMTKIPFVLTKVHTLFVQREMKESYTGFFAPFLSDQTRQTFNCVEKGDRADEITTIQDMETSIQQEGRLVQRQLAVLLTYFLCDPLTAMIGFTYRRESGEQTTRFWYKGVAIESGPQV